MKDNLERIIEVGEGISVEINGNEVSFKKDGKELKKKFDLGKIKIKQDSGKIVLSAEKGTRRESKMIGTIAAHLKNMASGLEEDFVYKLEICNVHFPMNVKVDGENITIKSFLGERKDRLSKILPGVSVNIKGNIVEVSSYNLEAAGQTAANLEKATRVKKKDRRIFQDGIFIIEKPGRVI